MAILSKRKVASSIVVLALMALISKLSYQVGRADGMHEMKLRIMMEPGQVIEMLRRSEMHNEGER
jgi:hypothetical protein